MYESPDNPSRCLRFSNNSISILLRAVEDIKNAQITGELMAEAKLSPTNRTAPLSDHQECKTNTGHGHDKRALRVCNLWLRLGRKLHVTVGEKEKDV